MRRSAWSKARLARMRAVMEGHVARGYVPGVVTLVSRRGETHVDALGAMAVGGPAMKRDTIFRIASMTKPMTAVAALMLVEQCKLRLDDPVDALLPELANRKVLRRLDGPLDDTVAAERPLTLCDLLTLRMGFGAIMEPSADFPIQKAMNAAGLSPGSEVRPESPEAWMAALGKLPLLAQPGTKWMYDTGFDVLGVLIERASGQTLEAFCQEHLFGPLGMKDTSFAVPAKKRSRFATAYAEEDGVLTVSDAPDTGAWSRAPGFRSGASGLVSTVDDCLAFALMLLGGGRLGRARILSRPSVELMTTDQIGADEKARSPFFPGFWERNGWGFGVSMVTRREEIAGVPGQYGWDGGYGTSWKNDPREGVVGVLMIQRVASAEIPAAYLDFWTSVYQALGD